MQGNDVGHRVAGARHQVEGHFDQPGREAQAAVAAVAAGAAAAIAPHDVDWHLVQRAEGLVGAAGKAQASVGVGRALQGGVLHLHVGVGAAAGYICQADIPPINHGAGVAGAADAVEDAEVVGDVDAAVVADGAVGRVGCIRAAVGAHPVLVVLSAGVNGLGEGGIIAVAIWQAGGYLRPGAAIVRALDAVVGLIGGIIFPADEHGVAGPALAPDVGWGGQGGERGFGLAACAASTKSHCDQQ